MQYWGAVVAPRKVITMISRPPPPHPRQISSYAPDKIVRYDFKQGIVKFISSSNRRYINIGHVVRFKKYSI